MTRIIGGHVGGRRIATPAGSGTRPTSDRVREALFSTVEAWCGSLAGLRVLDLYAGSGAVGLEAWSRGAEIITFVESDRRVAATVRSNASVLGCRAATVVRASVSAALSRAPDTPYDLVYLDPPYPLETDVVEADLVALVAQGWLTDGALVVVERGTRGRSMTWPDGLAPYREKSYGETKLWYATAADGARGHTAGLR